MTRRVWIALMVAIVAAGLPALASGQSLDDLVQRATTFEQEVTKLEKRYLKPAILESRYKLETRFNDARVAHMLGDYERTSLLLVDVVRSPEFEQFGSRRRALYMLGDSLYQQRNYLASRKYLERLVDMGPGKYYQKGIIRLLEVAAQLESYEGLNALYRKLEGERDAELSPAVNYMRGKSLYEQEKYAKARRYLRRSAKDDEYAFRSTYLRGVTFVAQKKYEPARKAFERIVGTLEVDNKEERHLRHLAQLALGRIAYERNRLERAVNLYERVPRESPHFDQALYELTWVLVSRKRYEEASRNADIFLYLSDPNPTFIPEMRLLKADLHLRLQRFGRAEGAYRDVIDQFKPVEKDIADFLARQRSDLSSFFNKVVERELSGEEAEFLPETVQKWIQRSTEMKQARQTVEDLSGMRTDIEESQQALDQIEARLTSGARINSFPQLAEGMAVGIETESELIRLQERLLEREYGLLKPKMTERERRRWSDLQNELMKVRERYQAIPKSREEVQNRERYVQSQFQKLHGRLAELGRKIEGQREQLANINEYVRRNFGTDTSEEKMNKINELRDEIQKTLETLEKRKKELAQKVAVQQQKVGVGDEVTQRESRVREQYRKMLDEQRAFLEQFHERVGAGKRDKLSSLDRAWQALPAANARLQKFFAQMRSIVQDKTDDLRKTIQRERERLAERKEQLTALAKRSKRATSRVAYRNFVRVKQKFDQIVLRGDVGLIDVAWQRKESKTDDINQLRKERRSELNKLRRSFQKMR